MLNQNHAVSIDPGFEYFQGFFEVKLLAAAREVPGVDPVVSTRLLQWRGYLTAEERRLCDAVWSANPLLFDFVVKRCVRVDTAAGRVGFPPIVFETARLFA